MVLVQAHLSRECTPRRIPADYTDSRGAERWTVNQRTVNHQPVSDQRVASWLFEPAASGSVFTPESLSEEHRLIRQTADEFMENEVLPGNPRLEEKDWSCASELVGKCAELGLLGTDVPEEYGGLAMDKVSSLIVAEAVGRLASLATIFGGQTGLSITPLLCFGTPSRRRSTCRGSSPARCSAPMR